MTSKNSKESLLKNLEEDIVMPNDVKKVGYMKKLKTMKKKYFVLRDNCDANEANLSYYDSEKKFKNGISRPKRSIYLRNCFSINRKIDAKHKYVLALYTKDDCFATAVEDETQLNEWLETMIQLQSLSVDYRHGQNIHYDHVWQVYINRNGLGQSRNMTGIHRLCLTANTLYIVKVDPQTDFPDVYEFPLISIRRCGHTSSTFFIELGRSSSIGPGELWIQAEDSAIAQNMHEVILNAMKSSKNHEEFGPSPRPRSASTTDKPIKTRRPGTNIQFGVKQTQYASSSVSTLSETDEISSTRGRSDSMPSRQRPVSESETNHDSKLYTSPHFHTIDKIHSDSRTLSSSPPSNYPLSSGACSTDSAGSSLSIEDSESYHLSLPSMCEHQDPHNRVLRTEPTISEEPAQTDDYIEMDPNSNNLSSSHQSRSKLSLSFRLTNTLNTSPLNSPTFSSGKSTSHPVKEEVNPYVPMSPVGSIETESLCSSRRSSGLEKNLIADGMSSEYMAMSSQEIESTTSEEYLNMAPLSASLPRTDSSPNQNSLIKEEFHLDKVKSYFSPTEENDSLYYVQPVRAYSIGSRPQLKNSSISSIMKMSSRSKQLLHRSGAQTPEKEDETRIRAFSMGSHANAREARLAARKKTLIEEQIGGPTVPIEEVAKSSKKASSAPVLSPAAPRKRSATVGSRPLFNKLTASDKSDTDLMEIDYSKSMQSKSWKEKLNDDRIKRSSGSHRQRSNSRSSTSSSGIGSASTTSPSITSSLNELNEKKKEQSTNIVVSMTGKSGDENTPNTGNRTISKETPNEYLQVVIMSSNQETKLPARPITSQVSQLSTVPSIHSGIQQSHTKTLPTNKSETIAQKSDEKSEKKTKLSDDSGDYVCLDIKSTKFVPQKPEALAALIVTQNVPKIATIPTLTTKTQLNENLNENKSVPVPHYENVKLDPKVNVNNNNNNNNTNINNEAIAKIRPISWVLPETKKKRSVPNAETSSINFRQTSCPSILDQQQLSLSPLISSKKSSTKNQQIGQTLLKSSPDRNSISGELMAIESRSFQTIGPQTESSYENVSLGSGSLSSSRPSSVSSERELNYASLDLAPSSSNSSGANNSELSEELKTMSPRSLKSPNQLSFRAAVVSSPSSSCATPVASLISCCGSQELLYLSSDSSSLSYAEIDFKKSEGLRNTASNGRN